MEKIEFTGLGDIRLAGDGFGLPENPAVLLLPTAGQSRAVWHGAAVALADAGRYAICIDLRGHGDSGHALDGRYDLDAYVADLKSILAALPSRAFVVGAGMGAVIAIATVGEAITNLVTGLALVDATIWFEPEQSSRLQSALALRASEFADTQSWLDVVASLHPDEPRPGPTATGRLLAGYERAEDGRLRWRGDPRALAAKEAFDTERLAAAAARITVPTLLMRGALNEATPQLVTQRLQAIIVGSEAIEIEGTSHYAATDRQDEFNAALLDFLERRAPRRPLTYLGGSEPRVLRDVLGCFGTGVTVLTTFDERGDPVGLTANSFTSVSLDPPLILFSLARNSASLQNFVKTGRFAVNVLHIGQQPLAGRFANRGAPRFEGVSWSVRADQGAPILDGALASFDCVTSAVHEGGDHLIFIGQVKSAWFEPHRDPLLYFRGRYRRLHFA